METFSKTFQKTLWKHFQKLYEKGKVKVKSCCCKKLAVQTKFYNNINTFTVFIILSYYTSICIYYYILYVNTL